VVNRRKKNGRGGNVIHSDGIKAVRFSGAGHNAAMA
jgi:hypothetical protein